MKVTARAGATPLDLEILTDASPERVLERLPQAVAVGTRSATVAVPGAHVDIHSLAAGQSLSDALAARDLRVNAMAIDPLSKELIDPFGGQRDLARRQLRPTRESGLADPLSALRACAKTPKPAAVAAFVRRHAGKPN